ncbi:MAG: hypothetical protein GY869_03510 [Planctomycetes bacterium]|nr:hypothetical protein [Planctomycetota bacterium]
MPTKMLIISLVLIFIGGMISISDARQQTNQTVTMQQMQQQLLELQKQMELMKTQHNAEIQSLKAQITTETVTGEQVQVNELDALLAQMQEEAGDEPAEAERPEDTVFRFKGLSLQKLNPEISASADMLGTYIDQPGTRERTNFAVRSYEINIQSYLDPFSRFKSTFYIDDAGDVGVEEAYFTRFSVLENMNLTLGIFRQQFGVINRWHGDALDQVNYPMALNKILGDGGINQSGVGLDFSLPTWGEAAQSLTIQITDSQNEHLFNGDTLGTPSMLFHYKNFRDLSDATYLEFGLSGLFGWNDTWRVDDGFGSMVDRTDALGTQVVGADMTMVWEPPAQAMYKNIEWRSEILAFNRDLLAPDGTGRDSVCGWGAFSYVQSKVKRNLFLGFRGDYFQPDEKDYASMGGSPVSSFAYASNDPYRWAAVPYLTWWQSDWVRYHLEYQYQDGQGMEEASHIFYFQVVMSVGPHKHERY